MLLLGEWKKLRGIRYFWLWLAVVEIGIWVAAEVIHRKRKTGVSTDE